MEISVSKEIILVLDLEKKKETKMILTLKMILMGVMNLVEIMILMIIIMTLVLVLKINRNSKKS